MVTGWLSMMLTGKDMDFDQEVIADSMQRAGFMSVRSHIPETPMGPMDLDIGKKT